MGNAKIKKLFNLLKNDRGAISRILVERWTCQGKLNFLSDEAFLKLRYRVAFRKKLNLKNPQTFNEKLNWLKLYDRKPEYNLMVDKYDAKKYVSDRIGEEYIIPTIGVWDKPEDIDFDLLPDRFVLKCTHDSGSVVICKDKNSFDKEAAIARLNEGFKKNGFWYGREWVYKDVKPRVIAEEYMEDDVTRELRDYKFFCFNGKAKALFIASERQDKTTETKFDFYDMDFNHIDVRNGHPNADIHPAKPKNFDEMRVLAEKLSQGVPHLRVDFYEVNGKTYFGELTFSHFGAFVPFEPEEWDYTFGQWIELPELKK